MKKSNINLVSRLSSAYNVGCGRVFLALTLASPMMAWAADAPPDFTATGKKVCGFFKNINSILDMVSIAVVTLAVIISGYQIAFAHKRIADVAPILIGGVLIGVASQVASMLIGTDTATGQKCTTFLMQTLNSVYA